MSVADQVGSDGHRIGLAGQPFEFESERNGEQAIDDRMLPALNESGAIVDCMSGVGTTRGVCVPGVGATRRPRWPGATRRVLTLSGGKKYL